MSKSDASTHRLRPVFVDADRTMFTVFTVVVSTVCLVTMYALCLAFMPKVSQQFPGFHECPSSDDKFLGYCHSIQIGQVSQWNSIIYNLTRLNTALVGGLNFVLPAPLKYASVVISDQLSRELHRIYHSHRQRRQ